jgi:hypothetical protein
MRNHIIAFVKRLFAMLVFACALPASAGAQWLHHPTPGVPRTADGKPNLTAAAPRTPDGRPDLSGLWQRTSDRYYNNIAADVDSKDIQPWAEALTQQRMREFGKDSMETLCLPLGVAATTSPFRESRFVQTPTFIAMLNDDLTHRQIFMDGRQLEKDPNPSWMGYSVGGWQSDTLVVNTVGITTRAWVDGFGHPRSEDMRITERFHRRDFGHMDVAVSIEDAKYYTRPFGYTTTLTLLPDTDVLEYVCAENQKLRVPPR